MTTLINFQVPLDRYSLTRLAQELSLIANALPDGELELPAATSAEKKTVAEAAPVAAAPDTTTSTSTTTAPVGSDVNQAIELDAEGLPWDERIHSSNKQKLAKTNTWQLKRGVDKALVESVKAELSALYATAPAASQTGTVSAETQGLHPNPNAFNPAMVDHLAKTQATVLTQNAPPPPAAQGQADNAPPPPATITNFAQLMSAMTSKGMSVPETMPIICAATGISELRDLVASPDLVPIAAAALGL